MDFSALFSQNVFLHLLPIIVYQTLDSARISSDVTLKFSAVLIRIDHT